MNYIGPERRADPQWWSRTEHERFERRVRRVIRLLAVAVSVIALGVAFSVEESCQRANEVRSALVRVIDDEIANLERIKPRQFPAIPRDEFFELKADRLAAYEDLRKKSVPSNCLTDSVLGWLS